MTPIAQLNRRRRVSGSSPLVTHVDLSADSRIELSAVTLANWVDKTTSMIEGLGIATGSPIRLQVGQERPDHWVSLVWVLAGWQFGSSPELAPASAQELVVQGPTAPRAEPGAEVVACSLHPWGQGFANALPGVVDYREVLAEPDTHWENPLPPKPGFGLDWGGLAEDPVAERLLIHDVLELPQLVKSFCQVLAGGGSLVVVRGEGDLSKVQRSEATTKFHSFSTGETSLPVG